MVCKFGWKHGKSSSLDIFRGTFLFFGGDLTDIEKLSKDLGSLSVFKGLLRTASETDKNTVLYYLRSSIGDSTKENAGEKWSFVVSRLYEHNSVNLTEYLLDRVLNDENIYLLRKVRGEEIPQWLENAVDRELEIIERAAKMTPTMVRESTGCDGYMGEWETSDIDFKKAYHDKMNRIAAEGWGIYSAYSTFMYKDGNIVPVKNPDPQKLSQLSGYDRERKKVIDNTLALLSGKPAVNVLLYGDAGTGKSSTVKAVVNEYKSKGLRLIELKKSQLHDMPAVIDAVSGNPLKFIIFIDDLSFASDDDSFGTLKAVLEGSAAAKTPNTAIYVTSNRRHLVREKFSDRSGDDVHAGESREEMSSLSERFGLKVAFFKPDKELYLRIVWDLAAQYGIDIPSEELFARAEEYAIRRAGRSGRAAKQFVEILAAEQRK